MVCGLWQYEALRASQKESNIPRYCIPHGLYARHISLESKRPMGCLLFVLNRAIFVSCWSRRAHDEITTLVLRQNDVATSFWRNNDVIIALCVRSDIIAETIIIGCCPRYSRRSTSIAHLSHTYSSDWCLIDIDQETFAMWGCLLQLQCLQWSTVTTYCHRIINKQTHHTILCAAVAFDEDENILYALQFTHGLHDKSLLWYHRCADWR